MKVTFEEIIETHKAWRYSMCCPRCDEFKYRIHQQVIPPTLAAWWVECENCGYETEPAATHTEAIERWKLR